MTAAELVTKLPEFPKQLHIRNNRGAERLVSLHPTPYLKVPRLRVVNPERDTVRYFSNVNHDRMVGLLEGGQPFEVVATVRFESRIEKLEARSGR